MHILATSLLRRYVQIYVPLHLLFTNITVWINLRLTATPINTTGELFVAIQRLWSHSWRNVYPVMVYLVSKISIWNNLNHQRILVIGVDALFVIETTSTNIDDFYLSQWEPLHDQLPFAPDKHLTHILCRYIETCAYANSECKIIHPLMRTCVKCFSLNRWPLGDWIKF